MDNEGKEGLARLHSQDGLNRFLLGASMNSQTLHGQNLEEECRIVATGENYTSQDSKYREYNLLIEEAKRKAREDAEKYGLDPDDTIALEQIYLGMTQAELLNKGKEYNAKLKRGERTTYDIDVPQDGSPSDSDKVVRNPHLEAAIEAYPKEFVGKYPTDEERINLSRKLYDAIIAEFNQVMVLDEGLQVRKSTNSLFRRSAILGHLIIPIFDHNPSTSKPKFLQVAPIHKIGDRIDFTTSFRSNLGNIRK